MSWSDASQAVIDNSFEEFGIPATYNGDPTPISIILDVRDQGSKPADGRPIAGQVTIEVRSSEVAAPVHGATFSFGARTVRVTNRPWLDDEQGYVWKMWAV